MSLLATGLLLVVAATQTDVAPSEAKFLRPGTGWTGPTLAAQFAGDHEDAVSIAHWTRVPDQVLWRDDADAFELGVIAYHRSLIDEVRFAVDGGPWVSVDEMHVSASTDHYEYGVRLRPVDFSPGWHEVRAIAAPREGVRLGGTERVLRWRFYNGAHDVPGVDYGERWVDSVNGDDANAGTATAPFATVRRAIDSLAASPTGVEGGVVRLMGTANDRVLVGGSTTTVRNVTPLEITNAPGHSPIFAPNSTATLDELAVSRIRLDGLTIDLSWDGIFRTGTDVFEAELYVFDCEFRGITRPRDLSVSGDFTSVASFFEHDDYGGHRGVHVVSSEFFDIQGTPVRGVYWMRDTRIRRVRYIGMPAVHCAIDCEVRNVRRGVGSGSDMGWAPLEPLGDQSPLENILVDGCRLLDIGGSAGFIGHADTVGLALVNSIFAGGANGGSPDFFFIGYLKVSQFHGHTLVLGCTFPYSGFYFDYPYIFGTAVIYPNSIMRGVNARVFFDENLSSQPNWNNLTEAEVSGMLFHPDHTHTHWPSPPAWSNWTNGSVANTYVSPSHDPAVADFRIQATSPAWGRIPMAESWHEYDIDARRRGERTGATALGAARGVGE